MTLNVFGIAVPLKSKTPCSDRLYIVAERIYLIELCGKVVEMISTELVVKVLFDRLPSSKCSVRRLPNRVLSYKRGHSGDIVLIECIVVLCSQCANLLGYFWIDRIILLAKVGTAELIASPTKASKERIFILSLWFVAKSRELSAARSSRGRRCGSRCWGYIPDHHPVLPYISLKDMDC